jgi:hypothetical protein
MWLIGITSLKNLDAQCLPIKRGHDFTTQVRLIKAESPSVYHKVVAMKRVPIIAVLGQILQATTDLKQKHPEGQETVAITSEVLRSTRTHDFMFNLISQVAQFSSVQEGSILWLFKNGRIRADQQLLLRHILDDKQGKSILMQDFFLVLRSEVTPALNKLIDAPVLPDALMKMRDFFQQYFGLAFWRNAFTSWVNFVIDAAQYLFNSSIDILEQHVDLAIDQYQQDANNSVLLNDLIDQSQGLLHQQIKELLVDANQQIDQMQDKGARFDFNAISESLISSSVFSVLVDFMYDTAEDLIYVSTNALEHVIQFVTDQFDQQVSNNHPLNGAINEVGYLIEEKINTEEAELERIIGAKK